MVKQRKHDMELVELANAVKIGDDEVAAENDGKVDQDGEGDDLGDDATDNFKDSVENNEQ